MGKLLYAVKRWRVAQFAYHLPYAAGAYHFLLSWLGALAYGFPSRRMYVIGVTGTKGKTTTSFLLAHILQSAGLKTGLATTVSFRIGTREWPNRTKQTMPGRFQLQKLLRQMARAGCRYAVVETSSEGIAQYRHRFVDYHAAVFTNLTPEHIERHGSLENYRAAKRKLFKRVTEKKDGVGVYNLDDTNAEYFLAVPVAHGYGFTLGKNPHVASYPERSFKVDSIKLGPERTEFAIYGEKMTMPLLGEFNVYNAAAAATTAAACGVSWETIRAALRSAPHIPGRMEVIRAKGITVVVDYAHEPASLRALYEAVGLFVPRQIIGILGSQGGGRDVWKRGAMGEVAAQYCDTLILTNEDPYDEPPEDIIKSVRQGVEKGRRGEKPEVLEIIDRRAAIATAITRAVTGDAVVLSGKGGEVWMCVAEDKKVPWEERKIAEEILELKNNPPS